jgi:TMEM175 potassium channel family protein
MKIKANEAQLRDSSGAEDREIGGERELERIIFFSDAMFAIAITLLVLDIRVPSVPQDLVASGLPQALAALWPKFLSYIISFVVIGLYCWQVHHRTFRYITGYDDRLVALNLFLLMGVAFLPFSVSLISEYGPERIALLIYLGHLSVIGLLLDALLWYAERRKLTAPALTPELFTQMLVKGLRLPVLCLIGAAVSFVNPSHRCSRSCCLARSGSS